MNKDEAHLRARAMVLIAHLRRRGQTQSYYKRRVENALDSLERNSPGRYTRNGWMEVLLAAMERVVQGRPHGGPQDVRDWWTSEGRAVMRAHVERVRTGGVET